MCAKQLYVKSNGQWVAALGGGSVVADGLATEQFVTDAIAAIPSTDLSGLATLADLNDALATIPASAITVHDGAPPQPAAPIPQALEDAFEGIDEGLHFFKGVGALVTVIRQQYQTTILINGPAKSVAKIVKSEAGLPTPENPSYLVQQEPDGKWLKMTSDEINTPFGPPKMVDIFALTGGTVDLSAYALLDSQFQNITAKQIKAEALNFTKSGTSLGYVRFPEYLDGKLAIEIGGPGGKVETIAYNSEIAGLAKTTDNTQNIVANAVLAKGFAFGDTVSPLNPGLVYTDTNLGYGTRLVLDTPAGVEYVLYASDLAAVSSRVEALESKAAPTVDLSPYVTLADADARYGSKAALDLLRNQTRAIFDGIYTREEADARYTKRTELEATQQLIAAEYAPKSTVYTKAQCDSKYLTLVDVDRFAYQADVYTKRQTDDLFMRIDKAFSKVDFDNQMALLLYSRKQIDDKLTAISPLGSPSINDPALADFKKSVLDEVKKLMAGGKTVPADIDWTVCSSVAGSGTIEARVLNGVIQLRGEVIITITQTGSFTQIRKLPANFPKPLAEYNSLVYGIQTGSTYRRVFVRWATNGDISICPDGTMTAATLTGATAYAY